MCPSVHLSEVALYLLKVKVFQQDERVVFMISSTKECQQDPKTPKEVYTEVWNCFWKME